MYNSLYIYNSVQLHFHNFIRLFHQYRLVQLNIVLKLSIYIDYEIQYSSKLSMSIGWMW